MPKESTSKKILKLVTETRNELVETRKEVGEIRKAITETQLMVMDLSGSIVDFADNTQEQFDLIKGTMTTLPTKNYIDDKINSLRGDFVVAVKNNESKINLTVLKLENKKVFNQKDRQEILDIRPFTKE